jgi:ABC-type Fe3+-siderophore transport system permease subunit
MMRLRVLVPLWLLGFGLLSLVSLSYGLPSEPSARSFVLEELRLPRLLIGYWVGAVLGASGAAFQALFQNPLATPSTLGTTAGASLFALLALLVPIELLPRVPVVALFSFAGALITTLFVATVALRRRARLEEVLLAGVAISLAAGAISQALHLVLDPNQLFAAVQWSLGQLPQVGYDRVLWLTVPAVITLSVLVLQRKAIALSALGDDYATSLGVDTRRLRLTVLIATCLGLGASVALTGPILFVGLIVPHILGRSLRPNPSALVPLSALGGAVFLALSDFVGRELIFGREIPVGVVTAGIGAPLLFYLVVAPRGFRAGGLGN